MLSYSSAILLFFSTTELLNAQSLSFLPPQPAGGGGLRYPIRANSLAVGDFNRDGKLDLVTVGSPTGLGQTPLTVSFGNGDGTFRGLKVLDANDVVSSPVVADFNGDGNLDIAFFAQPASSPGSFPRGIVILFGNGDGTFSPPSVTPLSAGVTTVITVDLNSDKKPDLIAGQTILIGKGDGTFTAQAASLDAPAVLTADFNKDGEPDLLLALTSGQLAVALGAGNGTFGKDIPVASSTVPGSYLAGDFDNDGKIDLALSPTKPLSCITNCSNPIATVFFLRGNGDGTFQPPAAAGQSMGPILAAADMNRDGNLDLIAGNSVLPGTGNGAFGFPVFYGLTQQPCAIRSNGMGCQVSSDFAALVADFNSDGLIDIAEALDRDDVIGDFSDAEVSVLLNDSPGDSFLVTGVSSASYLWPAGATSIVTAFGSGLANSTESAPNAGAPPTTLGGIRVHLQDRIGSLTDHLAPLFYVSPTQINFEISTADSFVYISIEKVGLPYVAKGMIIPLQPLQPDLYTVNSSKLAASSAVSISANGVQTTLATVSCTASCGAVPINVVTVPVYLSLYGTGFDTVLNQTNSACLVGKTTVTPSYAGPQDQIPGFDQINLLLPATLAGSGTIPIQCTFNGISTNQVLIAIQ